ncbi:MAG TPA: MFS transporter, partial [Acidimicrobiales bacterium]|nr:MFS transporter [Acidimicrobiales bacterium]
MSDTSVLIGDEVAAQAMTEEVLGAPIGGAGIENDPGYVGHRPLKKWDPRRITSPYSFMPLLGLIGLAGVFFFEDSAYQVLTPDIQKTWHLSLKSLTLITTISLPLGLIIDVPIGYAGDRVRRMRMCALGLLVFVVFSLLTGVAGFILSLPLLFLARAGASIGRSFTSTQNALIADYAPVETRSRWYYALQFATQGLSILGPALVGFLSLFFKWQWPFLILALPGVVFIALGLRTYEPIRGAQERRFLGADEETAAVEDEPAGFSETFRVLFANRSARRIYYSLPFLTAGTLGIGQFTSLLYSHAFHLNASRRGFITALGQP